MQNGRRACALGPKESESILSARRYLALPPGEEYAREFGLTYCVRSSREIDWVYQRNIQFLEDYLRDDHTSVSPATKNLLIAHVAARPGISLQELLAIADGGAPATMFTY